MWTEGVPTRIIAETLRITADRCDVTRRKLGLPRRESWHGSKSGHRKAYLPSPEEIRAKCLIFQSGWSDEERARRKVGGPERPEAEVRVYPESLFSSAGLSEDQIMESQVENFIDRGTSG
jgi:hypothetical protein